MMLSKISKNERWFYTEKEKLYIESIITKPVRFTEEDFIVNGAKLPIEIKYNHSSGIFTQHTNHHYGQRKLFLGELLFLCKIFDKYNLNLTNGPKVKILYIGSADGTHIEYLHRLFNNRLELTLYDNAKFSKLLYNVEGITIHQKLFDDVELTKYNSDNCDVLISDIRSNDVGKLFREQGIYRDMELQNKWVLKIKPKLGAMLKFKLPEPKSNEYIFLNRKDLNKFSKKTGKELYEVENIKKRGMKFNAPVNNPPNTVGHLSTTHYTSIKGTIIRQCYPPKNSQETRLIIFNEDLNNTMDLDLEHYDKLGIFHNTFKRPWITYHLNVLMFKQLVEMGYDKCFDCTYEIYIWQLFKQLYDKSTLDNEFNIIKSVVNLENTLHQKLSTDMYSFNKREEMVYQKTIKNILAHEVNIKGGNNNKDYIILIIILIILFLLFNNNVNIIKKPYNVKVN